MNVKIINAATFEQVDALIKKGKISELPSIQQGWRFNFDKEIKEIKIRSRIPFSDRRDTECNRGLHDISVD